MSRMIRVWISTNRVGSRCEQTFEMDEEFGPATDDEIQDIAQEIVWNMAEWGWEVIEDTP